MTSVSVYQTSAGEFAFLRLRARQFSSLSPCLARCPKFNFQMHRRCIGCQGCAGFPLAGGSVLVVTVKRKLQFKISFWTSNTFLFYILGFFTICVLNQTVFKDFKKLFDSYVNDWSDFVIVPANPVIQNQTTSCLFKRP